MAQRDLTRLSRQLDEIDGWLAGGEDAVAQQVPEVSGWSVAQQVDHLLMVVEKSVERLLSRPEPLSRGLTWTGRIVLGLGWFPRGSARAPKGFEGRQIACSELVARLAALRDVLAELAAASDVLERREPVVPHPYFGGLSAARTLRNAVVHTEHHLAIVRDIRRA
ncbi:MAG: DinB family protein [Thermoanaerobaculia bacterium]|nr:MAG: DinB family protein [Thermoanaerobaculia bacterium]